jgi:hypothetical protein
LLQYPHAVDKAYNHERRLPATVSTSAWSFGAAETPRQFCEAKLPQQATGNRQQATGNRQQATGNRQQATGNRQQATGNYGAAFHFVKPLTAIFPFFINRS